MPRFNGETRPFVEDCLASFLDFAHNMNIEHEDIYTRLFVQSLEGNVRIWFNQLQENSINSWIELTNIFKNKWGIKKYHVYYLTEFEDLKRNSHKPIVEFIKRFNKIYNKMPPDCKPLVAEAKVRFSKGFDDDFDLMLRERKFETLADMKINAFEEEANRVASGKLKAKAEKTKRI